MDILSIAIAVFVVLETLNIGILYFAPGSRRGNGVGVFDAYEKSASDPEVHALVTYLVNWVAGTKLIFVLLLIVVIATAGPLTKVGAVVALIVSILSFYWRLYPAISRMDAAGWITPKGYSRGLGLIIGVFVGGLALALVVFFVVGAGA